MIECCNHLFKGDFSYVLFSTDYFYRRIEYGICPNPDCGIAKFKDFKILYDGTELCKIYTGKKAHGKYIYWKNYLENVKNGSKGNQNVYYGDFKKSNEKDKNGNTIYFQLRKNFNNQSEVIGKILTTVYN